MFTVIVGFDGSERGYLTRSRWHGPFSCRGGALLLACAYPHEPLFDEELARRALARARLEAEELLAARADLPQGAR